jgi:hypothetical protein
VYTGRAGQLHHATGLFLYRSLADDGDELALVEIDISLTVVRPIAGTVHVQIRE